MPTAISLDDIVQKTISNLREVSGVSVQKYGEPRLREMGQTVLEMVFKHHFWDEFCEWTTVTLDGTTGKPSADLTIASFSDIGRVTLGDKDHPIPRLPRTINPNSITGTTTRFIQPLRQPETSSQTRLFRALPIASTGDLDIYARYHPGDLRADPTTESLYFDLDVLALGATYMSLEQDGANPGAAEMYQGLFESRLTTLKAEESNVGVPLTDQGAVHIPDQWFVN